MAVRYVKKGGDNSLAGTSWALAWETIQYGIDTIAAAGAGPHTLNVQWETYLENIELKSDIHLLGHAPAPTIEVDHSLPCYDKPIIDGTPGWGAVPTVTCENVTNVIIDNFSIVNGDGTEGAGVFIKNSQVTVDNCCVFNNSGTDGGGIAIIDSNPTNAPNLITRSNVFENTASTHGGGILVRKSTNVIIRDNAVFDNTSSEYGGGIALFESGNVTIDKNRILTNECTHAVRGIGGGIGIYKCSDAPPTIRILDNERIHANIAGRSGGGIGCNFFSYATIERNRITSNEAATDGGGIYFLVKGINPPSIANAIAAQQVSTVFKNEISENIAGDDGGGVYGTSTAIVMINRNRIFKNTATNNGGGVHITFNSQGDLEGNEIYKNTAGAAGGGISGRNANLLIHDNNIVHGNESQRGGGVFLHTDNSTVKWRTYLALAGFTGATLSIEDNNQIAANRSRSDGGGIFAIPGGYPITFTCQNGNRIAGNLALGGNGGGIMLDGLASPVISDNRAIIGNQAHSAAAGPGPGAAVSGGQGGGICMRNCSTVTVTNTVPDGIRGNQSFEGHGIAFLSCNGFTVSGNLFGGNHGMFTLHNPIIMIPFFGNGAGILFDSCALGGLTAAAISGANQTLPVTDITIR